MTISEQIISGRCEPSPVLMPEIALRTFVSGECGATALSTGSATFCPGASLSYHTHEFSEAVTVLTGEVVFTVEGRSYLLCALDCIHVPAGVAHKAVNASNSNLLIAHTAFASARPDRKPAEDEFEPRNRLVEDPNLGEPESIIRFSKADKYELAQGTQFCDLFAGRYGSVGICGGYGRFQSGCSLPCHIHEYDESITIVEGQAICEVAGRRYQLSGCDTAFVPQGKPHRFVNESDQPMAMIWVYAGSEPSRSIVDVNFCNGRRRWMNQH